jgi:hypothetical protein
MRSAECGIAAPPAAVALRLVLVLVLVLSPVKSTSTTTRFSFPTGWRSAPWLIPWKIVRSSSPTGCHLGPSAPVMSLSNGPAGQADLAEIRPFSFLPARSVRLAVRSRQAVRLARSFTTGRSTRTLAHGRPFDSPLAHDRPFDSHARSRQAVRLARSLTTGAVPRLIGRAECEMPSPPRRARRRVPCRPAGKRSIVRLPRRDPSHITRPPRSIAGNGGGIEG